MRTLRSTHKTIFAGLLIALGVLIPYMAGHGFGIPGTVLLPMHIPVLIAGLLLGPVHGLLVGVLAPVLSSVLTGMPPAWPVLPMMVGELAVYGLVTGLLRKKIGYLYPSLVGGMVAGRVAYGLIFAALVAGTNGAFRGASVTTAVVTGLPGIAIQLAFVPGIVYGLEKVLGVGSKSSSQKGTDPMPARIREAIERVRIDGTSLVVLRNGEIIHTADGRGVQPLLALLDSQPELLKDATVVDRIIGKAGAMLLVLGGVKHVYALTMSQRGKAYLEERGIRAESERCIDAISNRVGDGICPLERAVMEEEDPAKGKEILNNTLQSLRKAQ